MDHQHGVRPTRGRMDDGWLQIDLDCSLICQTRLAIETFEAFCCKEDSLIVIGKVAPQQGNSNCCPRLVNLQLFEQSQPQLFVKMSALPQHLMELCPQDAQPVGHVGQRNDLASQLAVDQPLVGCLLGISSALSSAVSIAPAGIPLVENGDWRNGPIQHSSVPLCLHGTTGSLARSTL